MGYYDFISQGAGRAPDIREDLGTILEMLRDVEDLAGISQTTWHEDLEPGNPTGAQENAEPHMCVMVGGTTKGYLIDAIDRVRAELEAPAFPWELTAIPRDHAEWVGDKTRGAQTLNDILFLKQAVGRVTGGGAVVADTLQFTLDDDLETIVAGAAGTGYMNGNLAASTAKEASLDGGGGNGYQGTWSEDGANAGTYSWAASSPAPTFDESITKNGSGTLAVRILDSAEGGSVDEEPIEEEFPDLWELLGGGGGGPVTAKVRTTITRGSYIIQTQADKFASLVPSGGTLATEEVHSEFGIGDPADDAYVEEDVELLSSDVMPVTWADVLAGTPGTANRYIWVKPPTTLVDAIADHLPEEHETHADYVACRDTIEGWDVGTAEDYSEPYKESAVFGSSTVRGRVNGEASYSWTRGTTVTVTNPSSIPASVTGWIYWTTPVTPSGWPWSLVP